MFIHRVALKCVSILLLVGLLVACSENDGDCSDLQMAQIEQALIPDTISEHEPVYIAVRASADNLCWSDLFVELEEEEPYVYSLQSYGTFTCCEGGCACPEQILYKDTVVSLQDLDKGLYRFNISTNKTVLSIDTMIVN